MTTPGTREAEKSPREPGVPCTLLTPHSSAQMGKYILEDNRSQLQTASGRAVLILNMAVLFTIATIRNPA